MAKGRLFKLHKEVFVDVNKKSTYKLCKKAKTKIK